MVSDDSKPPSAIMRSYLVMKAESKEALKLAEEWWGDKEVPSYIKINHFEISDVDEFVNLYNRCFLASPDPFCPLTSEQATKLDPEGIFVAKLSGTLAGFIACFVEKQSDSNYGEITGIGVLPSRRRKGVATALIKSASKYFLDSGVDEVYCEVYEKNIPSQMLIGAYGFVEVGRRDIPMQAGIQSDSLPESDLPGGKIMRRLGLRPRAGCETCRDI
ncbi:MAG: GNAT family N-acetyltransferase [Candidatus Thorarchaeota archaeon]|nr:GNAT family N-acetyltransferase [Candidatus Thorarchaeota archaeon]